mmetsp:Transcript_29483/g.54028  ORF Transcript_29483/g.54028 Transcript_29483/m.54028 type:complete len:469 (-) Transcript_29483:292-1698(-)|eukprot:CAMPEP_0198285368 /NCGR_PEP_ID=MMETSP1449-20131203/4680_1 /TAXON_ID=420275 /ORGANISM="Attheya septentrionalis, Strain CCMP2084" /LENGTH=468 /DNA_ID=CAMNT_0043982773 /DNA_START=139 /DNA_END=1545 /DNA_ORIENTATION=+
MSSGSLPLATYHRAQSLGAGTYGSVMAVYNSDGEEFAMKIFVDDEEDDEEEESHGIDLGALREISVLRFLRGENAHPNIVEIADVKGSDVDDGEEDYGAGTEGCVGIAMPVYRTGTLEGAIEGGVLQSCHRRVKIEIAHGLLCAVAYLHDNGIIHRDIKADNVMIEPLENGGYNPVLIDFSLAKVLNYSMYTGAKNATGAVPSEVESTHTGDVGTVTYTSPEVVARKAYGLKSDLWSVGVVLLEMILDSPLNTNRDKGAAKLIEEAKAALPDQPFANLVRELLEVDPEKRISARDALNSKLFEKFGMATPPVRIIDMSSALPLDIYNNEDGENAQPKVNERASQIRKNKSVDPTLLKRQKTIMKLCNELNSRHPMTHIAAYEYSQMMATEIDDTLDNIKESQTLLDCVVLASKFFEPELPNLEELEEETSGSFSNWSLDEYVDNESTIFMLMDFCLTPRKLAEFGRQK